MYETVEVIKKNEDKTIEVTCPTAACKSCTGSMFCNIKGKSFPAIAEEKFDEIEIGDHAELFLPPGRTISSTFITLIIPLLMFPLFYILIPAKKEVFNFLFGIMGIGLGFVGVSIYFHFSKSKYFPKVSQIFKQEDK